MYVHIDCNAFFASCEIADNPALEGKPVVVANDNEAGGGIILALNDKAKALGLHRTQPLFQVRQLLKENNVHICPADHKKYHRISRHIMTAVQEQGIVTDFVQYSVDEFFGQIPLDIPDELRHYLNSVKQMIELETHIPVSCGCGTTYTLAKQATYFAKRYAGYRGICVLPADKEDQALAMLPIRAVWGLGRKSCTKLERMGVTTAWQYTQLSEEIVQRQFALGGWRLWRELQGYPAITLDKGEQRKSISQSRTFVYMTDKKNDLLRELRLYTQACCSNLRRQHSVAGTVSLFIATNPYHPDQPQYSNSATHKFRSPTQDTTEVLHAVENLLDKVYRPGYLYKRAGITLGALSSEEGCQLDLFDNDKRERRAKLVQLTDSINRKFGNGAIGFSEGARSFENPHALIDSTDDQ